MKIFSSLSKSCKNPFFWKPSFPKRYEFGHKTKSCCLSGKKNGQSSTEFIVILGIILLALITIITFNAEAMSGYLVREEVDQIVGIFDTLESVGKLVFVQGEGSQSKTYIMFPDTIQNITMENRTILITNKNGQIFHRNLEFEISSGNLTNPNGRKLMYTRALKENISYSFNPLNN